MELTEDELTRCGLSDTLQVARLAAMAGAEVIRPYFHSLGTAQVRAKSDDAGYDLVTDADVESEAAITKVLNAAFPHHDVLGEETHAGNPSSVNGSPHLWVVDPLDGTNNFAHQLPHFAISIAYYQAGMAHSGLIVNPITGDAFVAERGKGAWRLREGRLHACQTADTDQLTECLVGVGFYYDRGQMMRSTLNAIERLFVEKIHGIRRFGTASLDLAMVGCGQFGGFFEYELSPWDFAAGKLFVEEAGGIVTTCSGDTLGLQRSSVLAAGHALHHHLLGIVKQFLPE